ncbi:MAG: DUF4173 domain-containing protein [Clostridia bacterium]|nr:DUF4173 domain-containing protein [Clostridia bacterium]
MNGNPNQTPSYNPMFVISQPKIRPECRGTDRLFAWLAFPVCFLLAQALPVAQNPFGALLVALLLFAFGITYVRLCGVRLRAQSTLLCVLAVLLSCGLITGANGVLHTLLFLLLSCLFLYFIYAAQGHAGKGLLDARVFEHLLRAVFVQPFAHLGDSLPALRLSGKSGQKSKLLPVLGWIALGLIAAVIPTLVIGLLLSYDAQFTALLDQIFSFSIDGFWETVWDVILAVLFALPLFGAMFANQNARLQKEKDGAEATEKEHRISLRILPKPLLCAAVTPILILYSIFFVSQWEYYLSAFTNVLPGEMTYAEYAREGFFQLCAVCCINALILLVFHLFMQRKEGERGILRRIYTAVVALFSLILIATAISKMVLYIGAYGMTQLRVYTTWLMLLLAAIFLPVLIGQVFSRVRLGAVIVIVCLVFSVLLFLPNVDGWIADYNVDAYLSGELGSVDVALLEDLDVSAVPALVRLERELGATLDSAGQQSLLGVVSDSTEEQKQLLEEVRSVLDSMASRILNEERGIFSFTVPDLRAAELLRERG